MKVLAFPQALAYVADLYGEDGRSLRWVRRVAGRAVRGLGSARLTGKTGAHTGFGGTCAARACRRFGGLDARDCGGVRGKVRVCPPSS